MEVPERCKKTHDVVSPFACTPFCVSEMAASLELGSRRYDAFYVLVSQKLYALLPYGGPTYGILLLFVFISSSHQH
jgi:hypothetical protein